MKANVKTDSSASITSKLIKEESVCLQLLQFDWYDYTSASEVCSGTRLVCIIQQTTCERVQLKIAYASTDTIFILYLQTCLLLPNKIHNKLCKLKKNLWFFGIINMAMLVRLVCSRKKPFFVLRVVSINVIFSFC